MKNNLISVIMSIYNEQEQWLKESIESILNQSYHNIEFVIVVDNPQNNELINIIQEYKLKDNRIKLFINSENKGLIFSLNKALDNSNGKYIARMDADDISHIDRFEKQLKYLNNNNLDLIGSNINLFKNNKEIFFTSDKLLTHKYLKKMLINGTIGIVHPTFFGKVEVFKKLNGYSNSLHTEDKEFLARVFCNGFTVGNIKEVLLDCRYSNDSITKSNAIYINKIGRYITEIFKKCMKNRQYDFDENYLDTLVISEKEKDSFNKKQILLAKAREELHSKNYFRFFYKLSMAIFSSKSTFLNIKINSILKIFKLLENIELKIKGKLL